MTWKIAVAVKRFLVIFFKADSPSKNTFKHKDRRILNSLQDLFGVIAKLWLCKLCIVYKKILLLILFLKYHCFFQTIII